MSDRIWVRKIGQEFPSDESGVSFNVRLALRPRPFALVWIFFLWTANIGSLRSLPQGD